MTDHLTSSTGHTWPCTGFYVTSSEKDRTSGCTCRNKTDHFESGIRAGADALPTWNTTSIADSRDVITAALPDLEKHFAQDPNVRRAIIQELITDALRERTECREAGEPLPPEYEDAAIVITWLCEKLKEAENND